MTQQWNMIGDKLPMSVSQGQSKTRARPQPPEHQYQVQPGKVFKLAGAMAETSQANEATDGPALDGFLAC